MTSNKTKALFVAVAVFMVVGATLVVYGPLSRSRSSPGQAKIEAASAASLQGSWEGALQVQTARLRLVLNVTKADDGAYRATLDSIDQGATGIPVNEITFSNGTVHVQLKGLGATFEGQLRPSGNELDGEWQQVGKAFPLTFERTTKPSTVAAPLKAEAYTRRANVPLQGWWQGTLQVRDVPLRILFKISAVTPKSYQGTMNSLDQGARNIQITSIEQSDSEVRMEMESINGHFEGTFNQEKEGMEGTWIQGGVNLPLTLRRVEPTDEQPVPQSAYVFISDTELQGVWQGTLEAGGTKLRLVIKVAKAADGTYHAAMDSPDQGVSDLPATAVKFTGTDVELEWKAILGLYHGQLEAGKLTGFWQQGTFDSPLDLVRTNRTPNPAKN
jgi:hypothetical protein